MAGPRYHGYDLKRLQCPATWNSATLHIAVVEDSLDKLCLAATPWTNAVERFKLAWSLWRNDRQDEARRLVVESYMRMLPDPVFHEDCGLLKEYRPALRFVLDSTWASMQAATVVGKKDAELLKKFIADVDSVSQLNSKQLSAVYALRARLKHGYDEASRKWVRKAIALNPNEGEWRYLLGWMIQDERKCQGIPSNEEISLLRDGYRLRKNPDTILRLARSYTDCGPSRYPEARALIDEAFRLYPDHPRVLTNVANILSKLEGTGRESLTRIRRLYERAQDIVGRKAFIQMKLGSLCQSNGEHAQAQMHFEYAVQLNPSSCLNFAATSIVLSSAV